MKNLIRLGESPEQVLAEWILKSEIEPLCHVVLCIANNEIYVLKAKRIYRLLVSFNIERPDIFEELITGEVFRIYQSILEDKIAIYKLHPNRSEDNPYVVKYLHLGEGKGYNKPLQSEINHLEVYRYIQKERKNRKENGR